MYVNNELCKINNKKSYIMDADHVQGDSIDIKAREVRFRVGDRGQGG